jgi:hypothetical protein
MTKGAPDMKVRISADLREKIEKAARENNRTMNAEIVARLERSFREDTREAPAAPLLSPNQDTRIAQLEQIVIGIMLDERLDKMANRVAELEKRLNIRATGNFP